MSRWWNQLEEALGGVADALGQASDWEGADMFFMHSEATHARLKVHLHISV